MSKTYINKICYCCRTCGDQISTPTALRGGGECRHCSKLGQSQPKGDQSKLYKQEKHTTYYCKEQSCKNIVCYFTATRGSGYCKMHFQNGNRNHRFGKRGVLSKQTKYTELEAIINNKIIGWTKWKMFRREILKRDKYLCQCCGMKATDIHHKKSRKKFPEFCWHKSNVISLCRACHCHIGDKKTVKVSQHTKHSEFIKEWNSIKEASATLGINASGIVQCARTKRKLAGGFIWVYK